MLLICFLFFNNLTIGGAFGFGYRSINWKWSDISPWDVSYQVFLGTEFSNRFFVFIGLEEWKLKFINIIKHEITYDTKLAKFRIFILKLGKIFSINDKLHSYFSGNIGLGNGYNIPYSVGGRTLYFLLSASSGLNFHFFYPNLFLQLDFNKYWTPDRVEDAPDPPIWIQKIDVSLGIKFKVN